MLKEFDLLINIRIIWCVDDHRVLTSRININARRSVIFRSLNDEETKSSHRCFLWGLDRTVRTIFRSYNYHESQFTTMIRLIWHHLFYWRQNVSWMICCRNTTWYSRVGWVTFTIILSCCIIVEVTVKWCRGSVLVVTSSWSSFLAFCTWNSTNRLEEL